MHYTIVAKAEVIIGGLLALDVLLLAVWTGYVHTAQRLYPKRFKAR